MLIFQGVTNLLWHGLYQNEMQGHINRESTVKNLHCYFVCPVAHTFEFGVSSWFFGGVWFSKRPKLRMWQGTFYVYLEANWPLSFGFYVSLGFLGDESMCSIHMEMQGALRSDLMIAAVLAVCQSD